MTTERESPSGSLDRRFLAFYLVVQHLLAGGMFGSGIWLAITDGMPGLIVSAPFLLIGGWWPVREWRDLVRTVRWFRLDGSVIRYRLLFVRDRTRTSSVGSA
jgi:hypothetical protein